MTVLIILIINIIARILVNMKKCKSFLLSLIIISSMLLITSCEHALLLNPKGPIAVAEKDIIMLAVSLMLIVVLPVYILTGVFCWKYRATNTKAKYTPDWSHGAILEIIWWFVPLIIISILATITWITSHSLDPYKPLDSKIKPITIQVISLDWKWLFIYPELNIATVNYIQIPYGTPINFRITGDSPMNSFWIPQLGGQIYAMPGMQSKLHLIASENGIYDGFSASFSGSGFSGMKFTVKASDETEFNKWVQDVRNSTNKLSYEEYTHLAEPSENNQVQYYSEVAKNLYNSIIDKFMMPNMKMQDMHNMPDMAH